MLLQPDRAFDWRFCSKALTSTSEEFGMKYGPCPNDVDLVVNPKWLETAMAKKIASVDWQRAKQDVRLICQQHMRNL